MRSKVRLLILLTVLLLLLLIAFWGLSKRFGELAANLPAALENQLEAGVGREVRIRHVKLTAPGRAVIAGISVADGKTFAEGILFSARRVTVEFDPVSLLTGRAAPLRSIRKVTIERPRLKLVRTRELVWNIEDLLRRPPAPAEERFRGIVRIRSGLVAVEDHAAKLRNLPAVNQVSPIHGTIDLAPREAAEVDLSGAGPRGRIRRIEITGRLGIAAPVSTLTLTVQGGDAAYWLDYFSDIQPWSLKHGVLNGGATIYQKPTGKFAARGRATVGNASITSRHLALPVRSVSANITFIGERMSVELHGLLGRSPVVVKGHILSTRRLDLRVTSDRMDLGTLQKAIRSLPVAARSRWPSPARFTASVTGPPERPRVDAEMAVPRAVVYNLPFENITARGTYANLVIRILGVQAYAAGGAVRLSGAVEIPSGRTRLTGTITGIRLGAVPVPTDVQANGVADAEFSLVWFRRLRSARIDASVTRGRIGGISFERGSANALLTRPLTGRALVRIERGFAAGLPFETADADLTLRGNTIRVREAVLHAFQGTIAASGIASTTGRLNLALNARGVDLSALLAPLGYRQVMGTASFDGRFEGTVDSPRVSGLAVARDGQARQVNYDLLIARMTATPASLVLQDVVVKRQLAEIVTTGAVTLSRGAAPSLELTAKARRVDLADLFVLLGLPIEATGTTTADLDVRGRLPNLQAQGEIAAADATVAGISAEAARVSLRLREGRTVITRVLAQSGEMRVVGHGFIDPDGGIELSLASENFTLNVLDPILYPYLASRGPMELSAAISGTLLKPTLQATLVSDAPVLNGQQLDSLGASVLWDGSRLVLSDTFVVRAAAHYELPALRFDPRTQLIELQARATSASIENIADLLSNSPVLGTARGRTLLNALQTLPERFTGTMSAALHLAGPLGNLTGGAEVIGTDIVLGPTQVTSLQASFVIQRSLFRVEKIALTAPGASLTAMAQFVRAEPVQFAADIAESQLGMLISIIENAPFLPMFEVGRDLIAAVRGIPRPATGTVSASVSLTDLRTAVTGRTSVTAADVAFAGQPIGTIQADSRLVKGTVFVDRLALSGPEAAASFTGSVSPQGFLSLAGSAERLPLSMFESWLGLPGLSGSLALHIRATGPVDSPLVETSVIATDVRTSQLTLDRVLADRLIIAGQRISTEHLLVTSNDSHLVISGSLPFAWRLPFIPRDQPILIQAQMPRQDFSALASFTQGVERASGTFMMTLTVTGTLDEPVLNGQLILENGFLDLQRLENDFINVDVDAAFQDSRLMLERFTGASSLGGTFSMEGNIAFPGLSTALLTLFVSLDSLGLSASNLTGVLGERFNAVATGQFAVNDSLLSPLIEGHLAAHDAHLEIPEAPLPTLVPRARRTFNPQFQLTVSLAAGVQIERGPLRVQVAGPLAVSGSLAEPSIVGTVGLTKGQLRYPGRTLDLVPGGSATFVFEPPERARMSVNAQARTRVTAPSPITGRLTRYTVALEVAGPLGDLDIGVSSSPPGLTEERALVLVFRQAQVEALLQEQPFSETIRRQLAETLIGAALPEIFEGFDFVGITFAVEPGFEIPVQLSASAPLTDRLSIAYARSMVGRLPFDTLDVSYLLNPRVAFTTSFRNKEEVSYLIGGATRF